MIIIIKIIVLATSNISENHRNGKETYQQLATPLFTSYKMNSPTEKHSK